PLRVRKARSSSTRTSSRARLARLLVLADDDRAFLTRNGHRRDLPAKRAVFGRATRARERAQREFVLLFAGESILVGACFRERPHQFALVVGVLEAVEKHMVVHG